jgi:hypothetical protein
MAGVEDNMSYQLSVEVYGSGEDPNHRSHWGFMINQPSSSIGDLLHVRVIDLEKLWYQFEERYGTNVVSMQAVGMCKIADLTPKQRQDAIAIIKKEDAPRDGKKRCQDWVFDTLISLEAEELVPSGTSEFWKGMVGKPARVVAQACGTKWIRLN